MGISNGDLQGRSMSEVFGDRGNELEAYDLEVLEKGATITTQSDFVTPDGLRNFETTRFLFVDSAGRRFVAGNPWMSPRACNGMPRLPVQETQPSTMPA